MNLLFESKKVFQTNYFLSFNQIFFYNVIYDFYSITAVIHKDFRELYEYINL